MKNFVSFVNNKNIHFKSLTQLYPSDFGSKKKIQIFEGVDLKDQYWICFIYQNKSRFIQKNSFEVVELSDKIIMQKSHNYKVKALFISSPLCSKAKKTLEDLKWKVYNDFM